MVKGRKKVEETIQFNFRIPTRILERIDARLKEAEEAGYPGVTRTGIVIRAIEDYLDRGTASGKGRKG